jgi:multidrug efflux pump subunit AcrB
LDLSNGIQVSRPGEEQRVEQLIPGNRRELGRLAESEVKPALSLIEGVYDVQLSGYNPLRRELVYDTEKLVLLGLSPENIARQIRNIYATTGLGMVQQTGSSGGLNIPVVLSAGNSTINDWQNIQIKAGGRLIRLTSLVEVQQAESPAAGYYRINGLNTITLGIMATKSANHLMTVSKVKKRLAHLNENLPHNCTIDVVYDSTIFLKEELTKTAIRIGLSLLLLLLFVWLVSRSSRYLFVIFASMAANISVAFIFYYLAGIEIHLYSLAGIIVSLGIIIDNTIVMADHLRIGKGLSIFRGILAATLTTGGALVVVFFLNDEQKLLLLDFVYVILINLGVSLLVSFFFVPALLHQMPLPRPDDKRTFKTKRRMVRLYNRYASGIRFTARFRRVIFAVAILGFGLPVFMLPGNLAGNRWYNKLYNSTIGSELYNEHIRKVADKALGGSLRLFIRETLHEYLGSTDRRTMLSVRGSMYEGTTLENTNEIAKRLENLLAQYDEVEQFQTRVYSGGNVSMQVYFRKEHEYMAFPATLKSELESKVIEMGAGDWSITGVGRGFDNSLREGARNSRVTFYGYNLEALKGYAEKFKTYLLYIQRVEAGSIFINGRATHNDRVHTEHLVDFNDERLARAGISKGRLLYEMRRKSEVLTPVLDLYNNGSREPVVLVAGRTQLPDYWQFYNQPIAVGNDRFTRMNDYGALKKERVTELINKENMEYTMVVEFDFIGSYGQKEFIVGKVIKKMADELPIGFRLKQQTFYGGMWGDKSEKDNRLFIILLVLAIIYGICAVVFESLLQPLVVLSMIPLSFIGVFLTFYLFDLSFGQGGYAALLLLSGLTVNSSLYIINDLNNIRQSMPNMRAISQYVHAFRQKIVPVMLTVFSTVLGLIPFLYGGKKEVFWFSMAAGTIGGLVFSLLALLVVLPLLMREMNTKTRRHKEI